MSIVAGVISLLSSGIIGDVGKAIDDNITNDEERGKLHNELATIKAKAKGKSQDFETAINSELSKRHQADMLSDSWLSKNIRPLTLVVMTIVTVIYLVFGPEDQKRYEAGLALLASLDMMIYGFYFGSRGVEKAASMIASALKAKPKKKEEDEGELGW